MSLDDVILFSKPLDRRRGKDRPRDMRDYRQRGLRDYEPVEQKDVDVVLVAQDPHGIVLTPHIAPQMQFAYQQGIADPGTTCIMLGLMKVPIDGILYNL